MSNFKLELMNIEQSYVKMLAVVLVGQSKQWPRKKTLAVFEDLAEPEDSTRYKTAIRELKRDHDPADCEDVMKGAIALAFMLRVFYKHFLEIDEKSSRLSVLHFGEHFVTCLDAINEEHKQNSPKGPTMK